MTAQVACNFVYLFRKFDLFRGIAAAIFVVPPIGSPLKCSPLN